MLIYSPSRGGGSYVESRRRSPNDDRDEDGFLLSEIDFQPMQRGRISSDSYETSKSQSSYRRRRRKSPLPHKKRVNSSISLSPSPPPPPPLEEDVIPPPPADTYDEGSSHELHLQQLDDERSILTSTSTLATLDDSFPTRSSLLSNQLISTLEEDQNGSMSPSTVLFPSRNINSSEILRCLRMDIADLKASWTSIASDAVLYVQDINATIANVRHERAFLKDCVAEKMSNISNLKKETGDLYAHLASLEKVARRRGVPWVRPPFIRKSASDNDESVNSHSNFRLATPDNKSDVSNVSSLQEDHHREEEEEEYRNLPQSRLFTDEKIKNAVAQLPYTYKTNEESVEKSLYIEVKPVSAAITHLVPPPMQSPQEERERRSLVSSGREGIDINIGRLNRRLQSNVTLSDAAISPKKQVNIQKIVSSRNVGMWEDLKRDLGNVSPMDSSKKRHDMILTEAKNQLRASQQKRISVTTTELNNSPYSTSIAYSNSPIHGINKEIHDSDAMSLSSTSSLKGIMKKKHSPKMAEALDQFYKVKEQSSNPPTKAEKTCESPSMFESNNEDLEYDESQKKKKTSLRRPPPPRPPPPTLPKQSSFRDKELTGDKHVKPILAELKETSKISDRVPALPSRNDESNGSTNGKTSWKNTLSKLMADFDEGVAKANSRKLHEGHKVKSNRNSNRNSDNRRDNDDLLQESHSNSIDQTQVLNGFHSIHDHISDTVQQDQIEAQNDPTVDTQRPRQHDGHDKGLKISSVEVLENGGDSENIRKNFKKTGSLFRSLCENSKDDKCDSDCDGDGDGETINRIPFASSTVDDTSSTMINTDFLENKDDDSLSDIENSAEFEKGYYVLKKAVMKDRWCQWSLKRLFAVICYD